MEKLVAVKLRAHLWPGMMNWDQCTCWATCWLLSASRERHGLGGGGGPGMHREVEWQPSYTRKEDMPRGGGIAGR